jgi:hypothetical protein
MNTLPLLSIRRLFGQARFDLLDGLPPTPDSVSRCRDADDAAEE